MSPTDKKDHALVTQKMKSRSRRTAGAQDYTLPKPYRRTAGPVDRPPRSKSTLAMLALAGLLIAGLIAELIAIVQENMRVRKLPVIAAIVPEARPTVRPGVAAPPATQEMARADLVSAPAPDPVQALAHHGANPEATPAATPDIAPAPAPALALASPTEPNPSTTGELLPASTRAPRPIAATRAAAPPPKRPRPIRTVAKPAVSAPAPDPDVVLVTAILMLTAKPELTERVSVCDPGMAKEATCTDIHGMVP